MKSILLLVGLVLGHGSENHNLEVKLEFYASFSVKFKIQFNPDDEHEREHMLEHLKAQIGDKDTKDMTADELQFYYFNYGSKIFQKI